MFVKLSYYAHSAQDKLGNLLPYEHWQTLQAIQSMLVNGGGVCSGIRCAGNCLPDGKASRFREIFGSL